VTLLLPSERSRKAQPISWIVLNRPGALFTRDVKALNCVALLSS
jgi:hypothetical protein